MTDRDRVLHTIRALLQKSVANGCTMGEALSAHAKAQALVDRYQVSHEELYGTGPGRRWQEPEPEPAEPTQQQAEPEGAATAAEQANSHDPKDPDFRSSMTARLANALYRAFSGLAVVLSFAARARRSPKFLKFCGVSAPLIVGVIVWFLIVGGIVRFKLDTQHQEALQKQQPNQAARTITPPPSKFADKVRQEPAPGEAPAAGTTSERENARGDRQEIYPWTAPVAQRAVLLEQDANDPQGKHFDGSVTWRTETVSPGPGLAPELEAHADIVIPERHMSVTLSLRRNTEKALPASHTIQIMFNLPPDFPGDGVSSMPGIFAKNSEQATGTPLAGISVKVADNYFLLGLSADPALQLRNVQLLTEKWFDIAIVYKNNTKAILAVEKGAPGDRAFASAFSAWGQPPPVVSTAPDGPPPSSAAAPPIEPAGPSAAPMDDRLPLAVQVVTAPGTQLTQSEIDALRERLRECWSPPTGIDSNTNIYVSLRVLFKPDGSLAQTPVVVAGSPSPLGPALAESAKRALLQCQPFTMLKPEHYAQWRDITVDFDPRDLDPSHADARHSAR